MVTGAASPRGSARLWRSTSPSTARRAILDLDADAAGAAARPRRRPYRACLRRHGRRGLHGASSPTSSTAGQDRHPCQQCGHHPAAQDHGDRAEELRRGARREPARQLYMLAGRYSAFSRTQPGSIVNLSSVSAQRGGGIFGGPHYSAAKAGILGLTKAMARELAPDNMRSTPSARASSPPTSPPAS